jgi:hypothetical protein
LEAAEPALLGSAHATNRYACPILFLFLFLFLFFLVGGGDTNGRPACSVSVSAA